MMEVTLNIITCVFEIIIFDTFFKGVMERKYSTMAYNIITYMAILFLVYGINLFDNSKLNLVGNIILYFIACNLLFEETFKKRIFYFIIFFTVFASVEIIFEFLLLLIVGNEYSWDKQNQLSRFIIVCLEKLMTFIALFLIKKMLSKEKYGIDNKLLTYSFILPVSTFGIYYALLYSGLMFEIVGLSEMILTIACILLLFANAIIFLIYDYTLKLNEEKKILEMSSLKADMEKKYYYRIEEANIEQSKYMHDLKFLLKTIGNLAINDKNEEIRSVIQGMNLKIGEMEEKFFCRNKVLNTILCEKKKEASDNNINYSVYIEPSVNLGFIQDIDIIIIMSNIIDNAIEASKKIDNGYIDISVFETQKGHFLMIRVENRFNGIVKRHINGFKTTKTDSGKHGIGMKNVSDCVNKYGGIMQVETEEDIFTVSIIITIV